MTATHDDLQRSLGRVEGKQDAMRDRVGQLEETVEEGFDKVTTSLDKNNARLAAIETRESERKGAWAVLIGIASLFSGVFGAVFSWWLKGGAGQ